MIAVAVSGGVDSIACMLMLKRAGHELLALHGLFCGADVPPPGLQRLCASLDIPLHVLDCRREFEAGVISYFREGYRQGITPNPCAMCNRHIKFGLLPRAAAKLGASALATGHYARLENGHLAQGLDKAKDQSYFLGLVPPGMLAKIVFPLGKMTKAETRDMAAKAGLAIPVARESQDICFLGGAGRADLCGANTTGGEIVLYEGPDMPLRKIGWHQGLWRYTAGQRRGLGVAWHEPLYVRELDWKNRRLVVSPRHLAQMRGVATGPPNFFENPERWPRRIWVKLRYNQKMAPCTASPHENGLFITLEEPQLCTAPGQLAVCYDSQGRVLCGSVVEKVLLAQQDRACRAMARA